MKTIITTLFSILFIGTCYAQPYQSVFGKNTTTWTIAWDNLDIGGYTEFFVKGDTIFNTRSYKKISANNDNSLHTLIREDTLTGKVWLVDLGCVFPDTTERLVADLSLQLGDTFNIKSSDIIISNPADTLIMVDSVYYIQGKKYIRFTNPASADTTHSHLTEPIIFVEGIGPNYSLLWKNSNCDLYADKYLLCVYKDSVNAGYNNLRFNGNCYPLFASVTEIDKSEIKVSPNPFSSDISLTIQGKNLKQVSFTITDITGSVIYHREESSLTANYTKMLDLSYLANGIYFLTVRANGATTTRKIVKQ